MSRVFLDTNVPVYAADNRDPAKQRLAHRLLTDLHHEHRGVLSTQVLQEFFVVATGKLGISPEKARQLVGMLADFEVVAVGVPLIGQAIDRCAESRISFWDALIVVAAQAGGCEEIWTEDLQDGQVFEGVKVVNPFAQLQD